MILYAACNDNCHSRAVGTYQNICFNFPLHAARKTMTLCQIIKTHRIKDVLFDSFSHSSITPLFYHLKFINALNYMVVISGVLNCVSNRTLKRHHQKFYHLCLYITVYLHVSVQQLVPCAGLLFSLDSFHSIKSC